MALLLAVTSFSFAQKSPADRITPALKAELEKRKGADEQFRIIITMAEQYDQAKLCKQADAARGEDRREVVINELSRFSSASQADLLKTLNDGKKANVVTEVYPFWIFNGVSCITNREMIYALSERPDIAFIESDEMRDMLPENNLRSKPSYDSQIKGAEPTRPVGDIAWNVKQVHANEVWTYNGATGYKGNGVVVAVIDTGVNYYHPDLADHMWDGGTTYPNHGYDFVNDDDNPIDDNGHGTHCAGTVAGNGTGGTKTGMAPEARIMALKVLSAAGSGSQTAITNAIQFATANRADVISMSLGGHSNMLLNLLGSGYFADYRLAFDNVLAMGVVAVVAAGNEGEYYSQIHPAPGDLSSIGINLSATYYAVPENVGAPGNCPSPWQHPDQTLTGGQSGVITIGASNRNDRKSTFSSFGPVTWTNQTSSDGNTIYNDYPYSSNVANPSMGLIKPDIIAPGSDITSCLYTYYIVPQEGDATVAQTETQYVSECGTSMATPGAAGISALIIQALKEKYGDSYNKLNTPRMVDSILEVTAFPVDFRVTKNNTTGAGRADAKAAIDAIRTSATKPGTFQVTNVDANGIVQNGGCVHLSWIASTSAVGGYAIWRDNEQVGTTTLTTYNDEDPGVGMHTYYVRAIDGNGIQSVRSNAVVCQVKPYAYAKNARIDWDDETGVATLGWIPTNSNSLSPSQLNYTEVTGSAFTGNRFASAYWGACFTPEDLRPYKGMQIDSLAFYVYKTSLTGTFDVTDRIDVRIYRGTEHGNSTGTPVYDRTFHVSAINEWTRVKLDLTAEPEYPLTDNAGPFVIDDISQDLWITFQTIITGSSDYPIGVGTTFDPDAAQTSNCFYMGSDPQGIAYPDIADFTTTYTTITGQTIEIVDLAAYNAALAEYANSISNRDNMCWSSVPDYGTGYNNYALSFVAKLSRATTYTDTYDVTYKNSDEPLNENPITHAASVSFENTPEITSGDNPYHIKATLAGSDNTSTATCPKDVKIVKVDGTYSETSSKVDIDQTKVYLVQSDGVITSDGITCTDPTRLIIEDGGQVISSSTGVKATVKKNSGTGFTGDKDNWHAIASPILGNLDPDTDIGMVADPAANYDLYYFKQDAPVETDGVTHLEWINYKNSTDGGFTIDNKKGYLYANRTNTPLKFIGTLAAAEEPTSLDYVDGCRWSGFNLIGNPYPCETYVTDHSYYVLQENTTTHESEFALVDDNTKPIKPGQAILVQAQGENETVEFSKTAPSSSNQGRGVTVSVMKANLRGDAFLDRARVSFTEGDQLTKYNLNEQSTKLYIPMDGERFAVAYAADNKEMPVSFQPASNGTYTLSVENNNDELAYLHLIDNMTGTDTDLLQTPSYTFEASTDNYTSRFRLLFGPANDNTDADDIFAYVGNQEIRLLVQPQDGAILQVVDVTGRVMTNENVSGDVSGNVSTANMAPGVYVLRLIEGEGIRTQKVVIE